jgi:hypothetical protein
MFRVRRVDRPPDGTLHELDIERRPATEASKRAEVMQAKRLHHPGFGASLGLGAGC